MFTQYTQADVSTTRKYGGTGLGLCILKSLVEIMGGDISVTSKQGVGSEFKLSIFLGINNSNKERISEFPIGSEDKGLGMVIAQCLQVFETVTLPLQGTIHQWKLAVGMEKAGELLKKHDFDVVIVDSVFIPDLTDGNFWDIHPRIRESTKFILLKDPKIIEVPKEFIGSLSKPIKPSSIRQHFSILIGQADFNKEHHTDNKEPHYEEMMLNILLVEDNVVNQKVASLLLKKMKCQVTISPNGLDAVNKVKLNGESVSKYDLILMDVMMPEMDGMTATSEIRKWETETDRTKRLPIVALTANAMVEDKDKCLEVGMDGYLSKPLNRDHLSFYLNKFTKRGNSSCLNLIK